MEKNLDCLVLDYRGFFGAPLNFLPHLPDPTPSATVHLCRLATPPYCRASQTPPLSFTEPQNIIPIWPASILSLESPLKIPKTHITLLFISAFSLHQRHIKNSLLNNNSL